MDIVEVLLIALSIYAIATLVTNYDGLGDVLLRLRQVKGLRTLLSCQTCTGVWVALPFLFFFDPLHVLAGYGLFLLVVRNE